MYVYLIIIPGSTRSPNNPTDFFLISHGFFCNGGWVPLLCLGGPPHSNNEEGDPYPPVLRKTGPHPPPVAPTRAPLLLEPRRRTNVITCNKRGGGYPSLNMTGGYPSPSPKKEEGGPTPLSFARQAPTPPPVTPTQARLRVESRRKGIPRTVIFQGGWVPLMCPEGYPPPPPLKKMRGGPPLPQPNPAQT